MADLVTVFHGELVEIELGGDGGELLLGRLVEADPGEDIRVATGVGAPSRTNGSSLRFPST